MRPEYFKFTQTTQLATLSRHGSELVGTARLANDASGKGELLRWSVTLGQQSGHMTLRDSMWYGDLKFTRVSFSAAVPKAALPSPTTRTP